MSTSIQLQRSRKGSEPPLTRPLDEAVWQAWTAKGREQDRRSSAARMKAVKWVSIAGLLAAAGLWSHLAPYEVVVRFALTAGVVVAMFHAFHSRHFAFAAVFGALALLYNPIAPVFSFSGNWQRALVVMSTLPFIASLAWRNVKLAHMTTLGAIVPASALTLFLVFAVMPATALAEDLSKYREFQFGTDLPTVAKQTGISSSKATVIHRRPALIQELAWRPQPLGSSSKAEPAQEVVFSFYDGELFRIVVNYDRYQTEGLTTDDIVEAISANYGMAAKPPAAAKAAHGPYGDQEEVFARWQDPQYRFDIIRSSYGPSLRLIGVLKRLEAPARTAVLEAKRLDEQEAPQRDAARAASEKEAVRALLEKARLVNKPKFRP